MKKPSNVPNESEAVPLATKNGKQIENGANDDVSKESADVVEEAQANTGEVVVDPVDTESEASSEAQTEAADVLEEAVSEEAKANAGEIGEDVVDTAAETSSEAESETEEEAWANAQEPAVISQDDPALLAAWKCLLDYDRVSTQQKKTYLAIRRTAIILSIAATTAAVLSGFDENIRLGFTVLALILVPTLGFMLRNYDAMFVKRPPYHLLYTRQWLGITTVTALVAALVGGYADWGRGMLVWSAAIGLPFLVWAGINVVKFLRTRPHAIDKQEQLPDPNKPQSLQPNAQPQRPEYKFDIIRYWLILVCVGIIATAAIAALNNYQADPAILWILRVGLIIIPIFSVGLLNYAAEYARSTAWIEYRVGAEKIRTQIYLYRTNSDVYAEHETKKDKLIDTVQETYKQISNSDFVPFMRSRDPKTLKDEIEQHCNASPGTDNGDHGLGELTVENYLKWRVKKQIQWYENRIERDYILKRRSTVGALVLAGTGSALVALSPDFAPIVALTTACGIAVTLWSNASTIGATYGIFQRAASDLEMRVNRWESLPPVEQQIPQKRSEIVTSMENIFEQERDDWETAVKQMQQSVDKAFKEIRDAVQQKENDKKETETKETDQAEDTTAGGAGQADSSVQAKGDVQKKGETLKPN